MKLLVINENYLREAVYTITEDSEELLKELAKNNNFYFESDRLPIIAFPKHCDEKIVRVIYNALDWGNLNNFTYMKSDIRF